MITLWGKELQPVLGYDWWLSWREGDYTVDATEGGPRFDGRRPWHVRLFVKHRQVASGTGPTPDEAARAADLACPVEFRAAFVVLPEPEPEPEPAARIPGESLRRYLDRTEQDLAQVLGSDPDPISLVFAARDLVRERDRWQARVKVLEARLARIKEVL